MIRGGGGSPDTQLVEAAVDPSIMEFEALAVATADLCWLVPAWLLVGGPAAWCINIP